jgi:hypothetical protein
MKRINRKERKERKEPGKREQFSVISAFFAVRISVSLQASNSGDFLL